MSRFENNYSNWIQMNREDQLNTIELILKFWKSIGKRTKVDANWFLKALMEFYWEGEEGSIYDSMNLLAYSANVIEDKEIEHKIKELVSKLTDNEIQLYLMCEDKFYENHKINDTISDIEFEKAINSVALTTNKSYNEIFGIWDKVDKSLRGIDLNK